MAAHSLAIHTFSAALALTGREDDAAPLRGEVGRMARERLPAAIGAALEPLLGGRDGVLRIDRIALAFSLGRGDVSALRLSDLLARAIARAIAAHAGGAPGAARLGAGVAFWPDHDSFAAAYVAHRLRLAPAADWAFPDFRPLVHLSAPEAALELIAARPAILAALARMLGPAAAPALAAGLPERTAAALVERLLEAAPAAVADAAGPTLGRMLATVPAGAEREPARAALATVFTALASAPAAAADTVRRHVALARLAVALAALRSASLAAWGRPPAATDLAPARLVHLPQPVRRLVEHALAPLGDAASVRAVLAPLLRRVARRAHDDAPASPPGPAAAAAPRTIASRRAGLGLLMPAALAYGLPERLSPAALHRTLAAAAGPDDAPAARQDPLLAALAPFDPRDGDPAFPPLPDALRAAVPAPHRDGAAQGEGAAAWAACLVHAFAAGLAGFEASSQAYLRAQFLARPGTLHAAEEQVTLVLDPLPLGILLRLCGLHGWSGRLPQAKGALLRIEIREG